MEDEALKLINPTLLENKEWGNIYYYETTGSTNTEAKRNLNVPDRSVFIAEEQTLGRGRLGRIWSSSKGCGVYMSISLKSGLTPESSSKITLLAGIALSRVVLGSKIKWPNDVLIGNKKVCGILTELVAEDNGEYRVIVGIGINVNNEDFPPELVDKATSIYLETGKRRDRTEFVKSILREFFSIYNEFTTNGFDSFLEEYKSRCTTLEKEVLIVNGGNERVAKAVDITENGELIIECNEKREVVNSGEVSVRGLLGYN